MYLKNIRIHDSNGVKNCLKYIANENKTLGIYISDSGCPWWLASKSWEDTREKFGKNNKVFAHHFIQSFDPAHGITIEEAHAIGKQLAQEQFGKYGFDFVVATHIDTGIIHNHIVINSVSKNNGRKYIHNETSYKFLRMKSVNICRENGIDAVDTLQDSILNYGRYKHKTYNKKQRAYDSWTEKKLTNTNRVRRDIDETIKVSINFEDFISKMKAKGYEINSKRSDGSYRKYITYKPIGAERGRRDRNLGERYLREAIEKRIAKNIEEQFKNYENYYSYDYNTHSNSAYKKSTYNRTHYYSNPYWSKRNLPIWRSKYRRKSRIEQILILSLLKNRKKIENYNALLKNNNPVISDNEYNKISNEMDFTLSYLKIIREKNIHNKNDITNLRENIINKVKLEKDKIQKLKESLRNVDDITSMLNDYKKVMAIYNQYINLTDSDKENFYKSNRKSIDLYKIILRELKFHNIDYNNSDLYFEKQKDLYEELDTRDSNLKSLENDVSDLDIIENIFNSLSLSDINTDKNITNDIDNISKKIKSDNEKTL